MATGGSYEDGDSLLGMDCPICLTVYKDPRALACCHTFCLDCLTELMSKTKEEVKSKNGIECPICRAVTKINKSGISVAELAKQLPLNYALVSVLQAVSEKSENSLGPNCQPCRANGDLIQATVFCQNCKEYQCDSCTGAHKKFSFMKDHTIINLSDSADHGENVDFSHLMHCSEHGKRIKFYCNTHKALCCSTCAIIVHKQCDNVEIKHVKQAVDTSDLKTGLSELKDNFEAACRVNDKNGESTYSDIAEVEEKLTFVRSKVLKRLDEFERKIRSELESCKKSIKVNSEEKKGTSNRIKAALQGSIQVLDSVNENASLEAKVIVVEKLKEQKYVYQKTLKEFLTDVKSTRITLAICQELELVSDPNDELGHLESRSEQVMFTRTVESLRATKTIDLKETENKKEPFIAGLNFLPDERVVMVDNANNECLIMDKDLQLITSHKLSCRPHSVTVLSTNEVLISYVNGMKIYKVTGDNSFELTQDIKVNGKVCSVFETKNKDELVVCLYDTNDPIRIIARNGNEISSVGDFPDVKYARFFLHCAVSKVNDSIVVSLSQQHEIRIIDYHTKATQVITHDNIICPRGLVIVNSLFGSVFVCCEDTHSIIQMSFGGIMLSVHKLEMEYPSRIAISHDNKRLVVSNVRKDDEKMTLFQVLYV